MSLTNSGGSEGEAGANGGGSSAGSSQRNIVIQRNQANQLLVALKSELALAKAAENDEAKAQQHYAKAENIKAILLQYQSQQKAKQSGNSSNGGLAPHSASPSSAPSPISSTLAQMPSVGLPANNSNNSTPASPLPKSPSPGVLTPTATPNNNVVTVEKHSQINNRLVEIGSRIKLLEDSIKKESDSSIISNYEQELNNLRPKYVQYDKICAYMRKQLNLNNETPSPNVTPQPESKVGSPIPKQINTPTNNLNSPLMNSNTLKPPQMSNPVRSTLNVNINANLLTPFDSSRYNSTPTNSYTRPLNTSVNNMNTYSPRGPINTGKPIPNSRPMIPSGYGYTTTTGMSTNSMSGLSNMSRMPYNNYLNSNTGYSSMSTIPDSGGRVLLKRKLQEVANNIGADEGDAKTILEGDVEDLLLDLADEFVTSITSFACKLGKHRKSDLIDTRDIQLHLERNWNIRVPGQSLDDIKVSKNRQPTADYTKKTDRVREANNESRK